jgi:hypothetical protein
VLACAKETCVSLCLRHGLWAGRWSVWECRVVLRGMAMHRRVLSVHFLRVSTCVCNWWTHLVIFKKFCSYVEASLGFS